MIFLPLHEKCERQIGRVKRHLDVEIYHIEFFVIVALLLGYSIIVEIRNLHLEHSKFSHTS